jgi:TonB family protein
MATTQIPPEPPRFNPLPPEVGGEHLARTDPVEFVPVLLAQLQDDLTRSRLREAFWISVVFHLVLVIALAFAPKWMPGYKQVRVATAEDLLREKDATFLELPPDEQKVAAPKDAKVLSDKNRIATSRVPQIDKKTLEELRNAQRRGAPGEPGPPVPQQQQQQMAQAAPPAPGSGGQPTPAMQPNPNSTSTLNAPQPRTNPFAGVPMSAGSSINQAAHQSIRTGAGGNLGEYGLGPQGQGKVGSNVDVLSDTEGVDFGPYLSRVLQSVRINWYNLIPEIARPPLMRKGKVSIEFVIMKDGRVAGMRIIGPSGEVALDRAAWGGITASSPFPPLPSEFQGPYLALRFRFYYNPDRNDMQ